MKTTFLKNTSLLILLLMSVCTFAQPGGGPGDRDDFCNRDEQSERITQFLKLNDKQKSTLDSIRIEHKNLIIPLKNQHKELKSSSSKLTTAEKVDSKASSEMIDKFTELENKILKENEKYIQQIRALLTKEQCKEFDIQYQNISNQDGHGKGKGKGGQGSTSN